jgi:hypothetical protein
MTARAALSLIAVFWIVAGLVGLLAPAQYLSSFGLGAPAEAVIAVRDGAVMLIGLGTLNWLVRDATGSTLRGLLWGNVFILVADAVVNIAEVVVGDLPSGPWVASFALNALLVLVLASGFREAGGAFPNAPAGDKSARDRAVLQGMVGREDRADRGLRPRRR